MNKVHQLLLEKYLPADAHKELLQLTSREIVPFSSDELETFFQTMLEQLVFLYPEEESQFEDNEDWMQVERDENDSRREILFFGNYLSFVFNVYENLYTLIMTYPKLFKSMAYVHMIAFYRFCLSLDRNLSNKCVRADWRTDFVNYFDRIRNVKAYCFMVIVQLLTFPLKINNNYYTTQNTQHKIVSYFKKHCQIDETLEQRLNSAEYIKTLKPYFPSVKKYIDIKFFV